MPVPAVSKPDHLGPNLGPKSTAALAAVGIKTLTQLKKIGWEIALTKLAKSSPEFLNLNMAAALIGAIDGKHWTKISASKRLKPKLISKP